MVICQSKYSQNLRYEDIGNELDKMNSTIQNFKIGNTGAYNDRLKKTLQNALDRLPDDNPDNIFFHLFTTADVDVEEAIKKLNNTTHDFSVDAVSIFSQVDIENKIQEILESLDIVSYEKVRIDRAKNYLEYESDTARGILVNIQATSLIALYNKNKSNGLFDLNIRRYICNTMVDSGIKRTLDKDREDFWFLNNGIIIACEDFSLDGNTVELSGFSIVNGGQTTTLIGEYKGDNKKDFSVPCKIICDKEQRKGRKINSLSFFTRIAEATNSQKPILPRDLKSNSPEMLRLGRMLSDNDVFLEIKRGLKPSKIYKYHIKNDELAQLILSMVLQRPGTSRSGKKIIFENPEIYAKIFKVNYDIDAKKKEFLLDLIQLGNRYTMIETDLKKGGLTEQQAETLKNGKQIMFALIGIIYKLANDDIKVNDLITDKNIVKSSDFIYGKFISNYSGNDIDKKLQRIIIDLTKIITESYETAYKNKLATSVSNHFKTDNKYIEYIVTHFVDCLSMTVGDDIKAQMDIFKR